MSIPPPPPPPNSQWYIDYYQLNASVSSKGDAAVLALIRRNSNLVAPQQWLVHRLILIDGGNGSEVADLIVKTLGKIQTKYGMASSPQFDAIIITHWDQVC